jgi:hypothetical protein
MSKIFCLKCEWSITLKGHQRKMLYGEYAKCPKCSGPTDGVEWHE